MTEQSGNIIQFVLDGKITTINFKTEKFSPTTTVLNYLRSLPYHKGVKEGCAEGDCGACTVVVAEIDQGTKLQYRAINSCLLFLPMIHGKQLITVENLAQKEKGEVILHPVQQSLVDMNGSQCGFCTPGIVMTLFALYKTYKNPGREIIEDALTGNLCRCTGYHPILKAALLACDGKPDHFSKDEKVTIELLKRINSTNHQIEIEAEGQYYARPNDLKKALELIKKHPDAIIINGSTDIALKQTKKFEFLKNIIDLSKLDDLKFLIEKNDHIEIGAGLSLEEIKKSLKGNLLAFDEALSVFASKQIREMATLGGNIGTASPIGDTIPLLYAYNAKVKLISWAAERIINVEDFIQGYRQTDLQKGELIYSVIVPKHEFVRFYKVSKRKDLDISTVSAGFRLESTKQKVTDICLAFGGLAEIPKRAIQTENMLLNKKWTQENIKAAMEILFNEFLPISDARADAEFRKIAAKNLLMKFYQDTKNEGSLAR